MSYWRLVFSRAFKETRAFWNVHQVWKYAATPLSAIILRLLVKQWSPVMGWEGFLKEAAIFIVFGFIVSWGGTYVINLVRVPAELHHESQEAITGLRTDLERLESENARLRKPQLTPLQESQVQMIRGELDGCPDNVRAIVRLLLSHGEFAWSDLRHGFAPGVPDSTIQGYLVKAKEMLLIQDRFEGPTQERVWFVRPELKFALEHYFAKRESNKSG